MRRVMVHVLVVLHALKVKRLGVLVAPDGLAVLVRLVPQLVLPHHGVVVPLLLVLPELLSILRHFLLLIYLGR